MLHTKHFREHFLLNISGWIFFRKSLTLPDISFEKKSRNFDHWNLYFNFLIYLLISWRINSSTFTRGNYQGHCLLDLFDLIYTLKLLFITLYYVRVTEYYSYPTHFVLVFTWNCAFLKTDPKNRSKTLFSYNFLTVAKS